MEQIVLEAIQMLSAKENYINQIDAHIIHIYVDLYYSQIETILESLKGQGKISISSEGIVSLINVQ